MEGKQGEAVSRRLFLSPNHSPYRRSSLAASLLATSDSLATRLCHVDLLLVLPFISRAPSVFFPVRLDPPRHCRPAASCHLGDLPLMDSTAVLRGKQTKAALLAVRNKSSQVVPTIDFSIHVQDDGTSISTRERVIKEVQAPAFLKPTDAQFFSDATQTKPDIAFLKNHFYREGRLTDDQVRARPAPAVSSGSCYLIYGLTLLTTLQAIFIITEASKILRAEPNLLEVDAPITGERCASPPLVLLG